MVLQNLINQGTPIPTYDQDDIEGLAHVFTGWTWSDAPKFHWFDPNRDLISPMKVFEDYHAKGQKNIVGGNSIPNGQTAEKDLDMALDFIFDHENVAPFIIKQLIQRLITSNPSKQYVAAGSFCF